MLWAAASQGGCYQILEMYLKKTRNINIHRHEFSVLNMYYLHMHITCVFVYTCTEMCVYVCIYVYTHVS